MASVDQVLALLEENRGTYFSGQEMAERLSLSRNAVWKAIQSLREDGYKIEAVTRKGYCLKASNDILSVQGIQTALRHKELAEHITVVDEISSTNQKAMELAIMGAETGTVIIADTQTQGRGHKDHRFVSPKGGLYMSMVIRAEDLIFENPTQMIAYGALKVSEAIDEICGRHVMIQWVNDLYLDDKKVCGILTEAGSDFESGQLKWMVLGVGINFRVDPQMFPEDLRDQVTGIYGVEDKTDVTRNLLAAAIIEGILGQDQMDKGEVRQEELMDRYSRRLRGMGQKIRVTSSDSLDKKKQIQYEAIMKKVDTSCHLWVNCTDGQERELIYGKDSITLL